MSLVFKKAKRAQAKLRLAITGPSGSGKTYGALLLAKGLGGKIAVIDTEHSSASLYDHLVDFDTLSLEPPYRPERFIEAIKAAEAAGYSTIIIDSITHEWSGAGGCLELNEEIARSKFRGNTWSAWSETNVRHRAFIDAILASQCHVIATMRSKTETAQADENGRKVVKKLGMKSEQRDGAEYEFTIVLDLVHDGHFATASKDRSLLFGGDPKPISVETGRRLLEWLNGADAEPAPAAPVAAPAPTPAPAPVAPAVPMATADHGKQIQTLHAAAHAAEPGLIKPWAEYQAMLREDYEIKTKSLLAGMTAEQAGEVIAHLQGVVDRCKEVK